MQNLKSAKSSGLFLLALVLAGSALIVWLYLSGATIDTSAARVVLIAAIWNHVGWRALTASAPVTKAEHFSRILL